VTKIKQEGRLFRTADIGYGYLKRIDAEGKVKKEKAVVALRGESLVSSSVDVINVDGQDYIVGDDVYRLGRRPILANDSKDRAETVAYKVLVLYALVKNYEPCESITLVTGLPFQNLDEAPKLKKVFQDTHSVRLNGKEFTLNVDEVFVCSQGLGTFYNLVRQRGAVVLTKNRLIADLGYGTINYIPVKEGEIDVDAVKTNRDLGIQNAYRTIANAVNIDFKMNFNFYEVDDLLDRGVPQQDKNVGLTYVDINEKDYVVKALNQYAIDVWDDLMSKYGGKDHDQTSEVVFSGGTSKRVQKYLDAGRRHYCSFMDDAQDAQVLGYEVIAKKIKESRNGKEE
jgi:hypothetical protein